MSNDVLHFGADGLIPAVIQDRDTDAVLMVGFMNAGALAATRATGRVHFWSRSRAKLWRKGETSGHEQIVEDIYVNCEQDSLLITVRQLGAVCHDGYSTCYYRRLEPDDTLTIIRERTFDPKAVYSASNRSLESLTRELYGAYTYLRDNDLTDVSSTSSRLRSEADDVRSRLADELRELAGALDGTHRHKDLTTDVLLEGTQVLYWTILVALRAHVPWEELRPDRALATAYDELTVLLVAKLLRHDAATWASGTSANHDLAAACHATLAIVGQACAAASITPETLVEADLAALREKPYLAPYFFGEGHSNRGLGLLRGHDA